MSEHISYTILYYYEYFYIYTYTYPRGHLNVKSEVNSQASLINHEQYGISRTFWIFRDTFFFKQYSARVDSYIVFLYHLFFGQYVVYIYLRIFYLDFMEFDSDRYLYSGAFTWWEREKERERERERDHLFEETWTDSAIKIA